MYFWHISINLVKISTIQLDKFHSFDLITLHSEIDFLLSAGTSELSSPYRHMPLLSRTKTDAAADDLTATALMT